jgi:hypothetical protein
MSAMSTPFAGCAPGLVAGQRTFRFRAKEPQPNLNANVGDAFSIDVYPATSVKVPSGMIDDRLHTWEEVKAPFLTRECDSDR